MILGGIITILVGLSLSIIVHASLAFARWALEREDRLDGVVPASTRADRRKTLEVLKEKARETWRSNGPSSTDAFCRMEKIDLEISRLDDEEVKDALRR